MFSASHEMDGDFDLSRMDGEALFLSLTTGRGLLWEAAQCTALRNKVSTDLEALYNSGVPQIEASDKYLNAVSVRNLENEIGDLYRLHCFFDKEEPAFCAALVERIFNVKVLSAPGDIVEFERDLHERIVRREEQRNKEDKPDAFSKSRMDAEKIAEISRGAIERVNRKNFGQDVRIDRSRRNLHAALKYRLCQPLPDNSDFDFDFDHASLIPRSPEPWQVGEEGLKPQLTLELSWQDFGYQFDLSSGESSLTRGDMTSILEGSQAAIDHQILETVSRDLMPWANDIVDSL